VKARVFPYLALCVFFLTACGPTASRSPADAITFDTTRPLDDFEFAAAGDGKPGEWLIVDNDAGRGLANSSARSYPPLSTSGLKTSRSRTFLRQSPRNSSPRNTCSMRCSRALDSA
jgi:hypothetical protein